MSRLIDADALIEQMEADAEHLDNAISKMMYYAAISDVKHAPTIEPERKWIPCSERLPEDGQDVLVTYKTTGKIHPCQYHDDGSRNPWYSYIDQCRAYMNVVLAWMPLPEPYIERREE